MNRPAAPFCVALAFVACAAGCALAGSPAPVRSPVPAPSPEPPHALPPGALCLQASRGAPQALGLSGKGVTPPLWSAQAGVAAVVGDTAIVTGDQCLTAIDPRDRRQRWAVTAVPGTDGMTADPVTVIVATARVRGGADGSAAYPLVDGLVGLDARTGRQQWARRLAGDGQSLPAEAAGNWVVVTAADGTVTGLAAATGSRLWADRLPPGCRPGPGSTPRGGLSPVASIVTGGPAVTVSYDCAGYSDVTRIDPATGARSWVWRVPGGSSVDDQEPGSASGVLALVAGSSGPGSSIRRIGWRLGGAGDAADPVTALDEASGRPLWQMDGLPDSAGVFAGAGRLCVAAITGVECVDPRSGAEAWQWRPLVVARDEGEGFPAGVVAAAGRLYLVAPTLAARRINPFSTTQRPVPGGFRLRVMDMSTGRVVYDRPLPAYSGDPQPVGGYSAGVVVSVESPPGVTAAGAGLAFVSPQLGESDVVEAFASLSG